jgi:hypothetical protein
MTFTPHIKIVRTGKIITATIQCETLAQASEAYATWLTDFLVMPATSLDGTCVELTSFPIPDSEKFQSQNPELLT